LSVGKRRKVKLLLPHGWFYTEVNVAEFAAALDVPSRTFKAKLSGGGHRVVYVVGGHVAAWGWE